MSLTDKNTLLECTGSDAQAIIETMKALHQPQKLRAERGSAHALDLVAVPKGMELHSAKHFLDEYLEKPERRTGTAKLGDIGSFVAHAKRFADGDSAIFANRSEAEPSLLSVLDYHQAGADNAMARFGQHRGSYRFPKSEQWEAWRRVDGEPMSQAKFADFIEQRIMDILPPPTDGRNDVGALALDLVGVLGGQLAGPSNLLEVARGLRMREQAEVTNAQNLGTGEMEVTFKTTHTDASGQPLRVPNLFLVGFPVFDGDAAYKMPIRLQYRRHEGKLLWTIRRYRPEIIFFHAFDEAKKRVEQETGLPVFIGTPES